MAKGHRQRAAFKETIFEFASFIGGGAYCSICFVVLS